MNSSDASGSSHPFAGVREDPRSPPPAQAASNNSSIQAPGSPPAAFPDGDDINTFWPPEPRPAPPPSAPTNDDANAQSGVELALAAAKADPFKSGRELTALQENLPASSSSSSGVARQGNGSRVYPASHTSNFSGLARYSPSLAVFPGQQQDASRDVNKLASANRDSGALSSKAAALAFHDANSTEQKDDHAHDEGKSIRHDDDSSAIAVNSCLMASNSTQANCFAHNHGKHAQSSSSSHSSQQREVYQPTGSPTPGASDADTSMMSQHRTDSYVQHHQRKRKSFKYLQDEPVGQDVKPTAEKRKKVQKACRPCKRSHMPCDSLRPCPRCIKRGIPELCIDAEPITRRPSRKAVAATVNSVEHSEPPEDATEIEQLARAAEAMRSPVVSAGAPSLASAQSAVGASILEVDNTTPVAASERAFVSSLDAERANSLREALAGTSQDIFDLFGGEPLSLLADPTLPDLAGTAEDTPFSHTRSYSRLARWAFSELPPQVAVELDPVTGSARVHFLQIVQNARLFDLQPLEQEFLNAIPRLSEGQNWMDSVPVPMLFARRSGEIYAANQSCAGLLGVAPEALTTGKLNLIQLCTGRRAVEMAKLLTNSQVFHLGESMNTIMPLDLPGARAILQGDVDETALHTPPSLGASGGCYVVSLRSTEWQHGLPLAVFCTLTPVAVGLVRL